MPPPAAFLLLGQRFIIDSEVFCNVTYDEIVYQETKVWRPMPDPLDAWFVLGNDDAAELLQEQMDTYHYAPNLARMRYLVDAHDDDFWDGSLYNSWLHALRALNPASAPDSLPLFARTSAWRQLKLQTQLASWAELRHDNILYAKQSYTDGTWCSYPHGYVEPYPEFYRRVGAFAAQAQEKLAGVTFDVYTPFLPEGFSYLSHVKNTMDTLASIAECEVDGRAFSPEQVAFLERTAMSGGACGSPPISGWYSLLYLAEVSDYFLGDCLIADVHTQPTDQGGGMVGNVLHVATGNVNLGVFVAPAPSSAFQPTAYVGPVYSYYETQTTDFERLTDSDWKDIVSAGEQPPRPDWVHCFLADTTGSVMPAGRMLTGTAYSLAVGPNHNAGPAAHTMKVHRTIQGGVVVALKGRGLVDLSLFDSRGRAVVRTSMRSPGRVVVPQSALSRGMYVVRARAQDGAVTSRSIIVH